MAMYKQAFNNEINEKQRKIDDRLNIGEIQLVFETLPPNNQILYSQVWTIHKFDIIKIVMVASKKDNND